MKNKLLIISLFSIAILSMAISAKAYYPDLGCYSGAVYSTLTGQRCYIESRPTISGISGPQVLNVNQTGTWKITAMDTIGRNLSYSVNWGDESYATPMMATSVVAEPLQQSAIFTHTYSRPGTYNPTFTVMTENTIRCITTPCPSNSGSATTSLSVQVKGSSLTVRELTEVDSGKTLTFSKGQIIKIRLRNPGNGGFTFNQPVYDRSILNLINHQIIPPIVMIPGNAGEDVWEFQVINNGQTNLNITASRSWSGEVVNLFSSYIVVNGYDFIDNGCLQGQLYSSVTGQRCQIIVDDGCSYGNRYSVTTGQLCKVCLSPGFKCGYIDNDYSFSRTLKRGLSGEDVRKLQELLGLIADGVYGWETAEKVRIWQVENGLYGDGIFGPSSRSRFGY